MGYILSAVTARAHDAQGIRSVGPEAFPRYPFRGSRSNSLLVGEMAAEAEALLRCSGTAIGETN
jgi:hypothetical protein